MKVVSIVGARPQFIKAAPLSEQLRKRHTEVLVHTGQHYDVEMSDIFFSQLGIPIPHYNLEVGSADHGEQTARMLMGIEKILINEKPDIVITFGDTNSTLAGSLAAVKIHIPAAHVEAGLRSFNRKMPEEINRIVADQVSDILFAPTKTAAKNLKRESVMGQVFQCGDIMYDAILKMMSVASRKSNIIRKLDLGSEDYILITVHRAENTDNLDNLSKITEALSQMSIKVVFPVHPRTHKVLRQSKNLDMLRKNKKVLVIEPVGYLDFLMLEKHAKKIITDSGGVQKEAYFLSKPCITIRSETEWVETVADGWNVITGVDPEKILDAVKNFNPKGEPRKLFGDGDSAKKMVNSLEKWLSNG